jgi:hypothetical protein
MTYNLSEPQLFMPWASAGARAGADDLVRLKSCAGLLRRPHAMHEAAGRKRNGEATARTFRDIVGSSPDLVRPTLLCACKQPAIPYIRLHHE